MDIQVNFTNKVAESSLISLDLASYYPVGERVLFDIKDQLFQGLMLREKDFREFVKTHNWSLCANKHVAVHCSTDAIVPTWAYMLVASRLSPHAQTVVFGDLAALELTLFDRALATIPIESYRDQRIVVKGCGDIPVPTSAYVTLAEKLSKVAQSVFFGEPCSTVPVYKRKTI
jgi:hypothetical protein